jgi:hypothetical protein
LGAAGAVSPVNDRFSYKLPRRDRFHSDSNSVIIFYMNAVMTQCAIDLDQCAIVGSLYRWWTGFCAAGIAVLP